MCSVDDVQLPAAWGAAAELNGLFWLDLGSNSITGNIPSEYASNPGLGGTLLNWTAVVDGDSVLCTGLVLNGNSLSGPVPDALKGYVGELSAPLHVLWAL